MSENMGDDKSNSIVGPSSQTRRVVLVDNFFYHAEEGVLRVDISPHLGLMSLATRLEEAGHHVDLFDPKRLFALRSFKTADRDFIEAWAAELCLRSPDVLGFTAYGLSFPFVVEAAQAVRRRRPLLPIIIGGPHATILAERILSALDCFDVIARYECESRIVSLIEAVCSGSSLERIGGLAFRTDDGVIRTTPLRETLIDMSDVPRPALHLYPSDMIQHSLPLEAGRGCPFDCTFCSTATFFQRRYRVKANATLIDEMHWANGHFGSRRFDLNHDLFGLKREVLDDFCVRVAETGYEWSCSMRPDQVDGALGTRLTKAGCSEVYLGFEAGSQRMQAVIRKRLNLAAAEHDLGEFLLEGPRVTVSFITGFPQETTADQDATLDMIGRLLRLNPRRVRAQLHILTPEPGTELDRSHPDTSLDGAGPENMPVPFPTLIKDHPQLFSVFRHFNCRISRLRVRQASIFVQRILPQLEVQLAVQVVESVFDGCLSAMFAACRTTRPELDTELSSDTLTSIMWRRLHSSLAGTHWAELVRFRRASALLASRMPERQLAEALEELDLVPIPGGGATGTFAYDVLSLSRYVTDECIPDFWPTASTFSFICQRDTSGTLFWSDSNLL